MNRILPLVDNFQHLDGDDHLVFARAVMALRCTGCFPASCRLHDQHCSSGGTGSRRQGSGWEGRGQFLCSGCVQTILLWTDKFDVITAIDDGFNLLAKFQIPWRPCPESEGWTNAWHSCCLANQAGSRTGCHARCSLRSRSRQADRARCPDWWWALLKHIGPNFARMINRSYR